MTRKEMIVILEVIATAYPKTEISEKTKDLWFNLLGDLDFKIVQMAVKKLILESPYVPTISDIRKQAVEIIHPSIDAAEAYGQIRRAVREYGYDNVSKALESMSPLTRKIAEYIGWSNICLTENPEIVRAQFLKMYEQAKEKEQKETLLPKELKEQIKALAGGKALSLKSSEEKI